MGFVNRRVWITVVFFLIGLIRLASAAEVEFFSPTGEVKKVRQVAVRFSEQMVAFGDPREVNPFDIACPSEGKGRWADQRNWIYDFDHDLPAGVACSFTIKQGLVSLEGKPVKSTYAFSFNTGGPAILESEPYQGSASVDENQIFILGLDAPATIDSIKKNAYCQADGIGEQIPVEIIIGKLRKSILDLRGSFLTRYYYAVFKRGASEGRTIIFGVDEKGTEREKFLKLQDGVNSPIVVLKCQRTFPSSANIKLVWGRGITSISGIETKHDQMLSFRSRPVFEAKFSCERVNENAQCIPVLPMQLNFSAPISVGIAQQIKLVSSNGRSIQAIITDKEKKGRFVQWIRFPTPLPEKSKFKITLPKGIADDSGRNLSNGSVFPLEVGTDENPPLAKFSANFGILELNASANTPPLLPVTLRNVEPALAANLAFTPIPGQTLHDNNEIKVIRWLQRLQTIDNYGNREPDMGPGKRSIFESEKKESLIPMTIPKPLGDKEFEVVGIPLREPGFYVVELASPRLGAALHGKERPYYAHAAALVTNMAVHFKQGRESSLVWVTSLDKGKPVVDANVAVRDCDGKIYVQGKTDSQGLLHINQELPPLTKLPGCMNSYDKQYFVTVQSGKDFSFVLSNWNEGIALWRYNLYENRRDDNDVTHAILDRTLLRAGETVHMKLIARRMTGTGFEFPENTPSSTVTIVHQGSDDKFELPVTWDKHGTATVNWTIPEDAKQGTYVIEAPEVVGNFRVANFRVPSMKAVMQATDKNLINVEQASVNIQVNYLSGGGASLLPVKLRGQLTQKIVSFSDYEDFTFANGSVKLGIQKINHDPWYSGEYVESDANEDQSSSSSSNPVASIMLSTQELRLDGDGSGRAIFTQLPKSDVPKQIQAELEYQDPNGETLTTATNIPLWASQVVVGIKPDGWMSTAEHLKFQVLVLDINGKPVVGGNVAVKAMQREYFSHRRRLIGGFYSFDTHNEIKALSEICQGVTDNKGLLFCDVKSPATGNIILQAETKDANGNISVANHEIWVAGNDDWWFDASDNDRIDLLPEKKRYEPGEKASFQLRMPFKEADVLVTVEREGVIDSFVTHITRANPTIEVPIKGSYSPNVFISALAIRGRVNDVQPTAMIDLGKPAFKMGISEIKVGWSSHELKVQVATDKPKYRVREEAKVNVNVKRIDGSYPPRDSEVVLVAVDEGLLELRPNESWKLLEAMMTRRGIEVSTSTAQMQVIGKRHFGRKALAVGGDGSARSARELFDTLLFWQARVKLDDHGHAEATIPLNDSLTSFRIVAIANGDTGLFGTGSTSIQSTQDLMLFSGLPPVIREQDQFHASFTVHNASNRAIDAIVSAKRQFGLASPSVNGKTDLTPIVINLPPGESRNVGWDITVPIDKESMKWDVSINEKGAKEDSDHLKVTQKIIAAVPVRTLQATIMQLEAPQSINVKIPEGSIPGRGGIKVTFRKQLGDGLGGVHEYMTNYPYTCLEQQASQAVALQDEARWNGLMKKLPSFLDQDGLAKYFTIMTTGDDTLTSYLLSVANEAGYSIPESLLTKMQNGLIGFVEGRVIRYSALPTTDLTVRKLAAIEALSRIGDVKSNWLDSISIEPNLWPTSAVIDWLSILQRKPGISAQSSSQIYAAQQIIRSRLNFQGTTMGFSTERNDTLWWLMINGDVNANRALLTLLQQPSWQVDIPRLVRGSLGRQQRGHWSTTVANAWGVLAMKKFSAIFESIPVTGKSSAVLGDNHFDTEWSNDVKSSQKLLGWPVSAADVNLSHNGSGKPWVMLQSLAALPLKKPLFTGYRVERQIIPVSQKNKGEWHKGDVVRIHLDIDSQSDMSWVVVNDPIPSGSTILGTGLGGDSKILSQGEKKQGWVWPAFEERTFDSFRAYYRFVPKGKFTLEYTVRLNNEGTFQLPTTRVEAMYAPEMFGELPNRSVVVMP